MRRRPHGFSLVETMMVLAILGVAFSIGAPGVRDLMANQRMKSAAFNLVASTMLARSEAIKRGSANGVYLIAPSNDLTNGWCISISTSACSLTSPDLSSTIRLQQSVSGVTYAFYPTSAAGPIRFNRSGRLTTAYKIQITDNDVGSLQRCVTIDVSGNARSSTGACS